MKAVLPLEIVDLILSLSLQQDGAADNGTDSPRRALQRFATASSPSVMTAQSAEQPINVQQAVIISAISRHHRSQFQIELYRHVTLSTVQVIALFGRTIASRPDLGTHVRSLVVLCDAAERHRSAGAAAASYRAPADAILAACPNATHLLLSCNQFDRLSAGVYNLRRPKEVTLVNVTEAQHLDGIVTRHRDLTAAALQNDPRIQAILGASTAAATPSQRAPLLADLPSSSDAQGSRLEGSAPAPVPVSQAERSLSHLHLVNFDGRLLHHLATVSSLTHLVLTNPLVPETRPGVPGLSVIPRSHLMLLLGSGNIARIIIRADLATCVRVMEELEPVEDRKLVFRPIRGSDDLLSPDQARRARTMARLGTQASALYDAVVTSKLDLLSEFYNRVRLHLLQRDPPTSSSSSGDPDTSRDSSGRTSQGRSSDSSGGGTSQSASTGWGDDDDPGHLPHQDDDTLEDFSDDDMDESDDAEGAAGALLSLPPQSDISSNASTLPTRFTNAPPLNIPIEELLRGERFTPAGLVGRNAPSQSGTEHSSASHGFTSSSSSSPRHHRQRIRRAPFVLRRADLRGATQANIEICAELYEALAADAGLETEMHFW
ncbi:uncharacterized protein UTRI_04173_B [Ustilago trichophora]|uniref:F-box domain-containing protein n=1 Tax=Ustilago trichophora TaxID=86804 RepID=A0A5C3E9M2_9BASI|nr:uncharacterized protein UTRI_04173_B [Ustilago trichophora]